MKKTYPRLISTVIDEALREANLETTAHEHRAAYLWGEVMGPGINRYTARRYVADGVMHVYLTSAPLKNELSFHRERIVRSINDAVGTDIIKDIIFH